MPWVRVTVLIMRVGLPDPRGGSCITEDRGKPTYGIATGQQVKACVVLRKQQRHGRAQAWMQTRWRSHPVSGTLPTVRGRGGRPETLNCMTAAQLCFLSIGATQGLAVYGGEWTWGHLVTEQKEWEQPSEEHR